MILYCVVLLANVPSLMGEVWSPPSDSVFSGSPGESTLNALEDLVQRETCMSWRDVHERSKERTTLSGPADARFSFHVRRLSCRHIHERKEEADLPVAKEGMSRRLCSIVTRVRVEVGRQRSSESWQAGCP